MRRSSYPTRTPVRRDTSRHNASNSNTAVAWSEYETALYDTIRQSSVSLENRRAVRPSSKQQMDLGHVEDFLLDCRAAASVSQGRVNELTWRGKQQKVAANEFDGIYAFTKKVKRLHGMQGVGGSSPPGSTTQDILSLLGAPACSFGALKFGRDIGQKWA